MKTKRIGFHVITYDVRYTKRDGDGCSPVSKFGCVVNVLWIVLFIIEMVTHGHRLDPLFTFVGLSPVPVWARDGIGCWSMIIATFIWPFAIIKVISIPLAIMRAIGRIRIQRIESILAFNQRIDAERAARQARELQQELAHQKAMREEREKKERERAAEEARKATAKRNELARIQAEETRKQNEFSRLRFDNWKRHPREPLTAELPNEWAPLRWAGLAYVNVSAYGSVPPAQSYNHNFGRWETVGPQVASERGIYLICPVNQRRVSASQPLVVMPRTLPGTTNNDLVLFILNNDGEVIYLYNETRNEVYSAQGLDAWTIKKIEKAAQVLYGIYEKVIATGNVNQSIWT